MTAPPTGTFETYAAVGNLDDLSDIIYNIDPTDTPGLSSFPTTTATAVLHEWQIDSLASAVATNYVEEGLDAATDAATATVRKSNTCQISDKVPRVSGTQQAVAKAGRGDELEYQIAKMAKELKRDMETQIFANNAEVTGSSGVPREVGGIPAWLTSNLSEASNAVTSTGSGDNARTAGTAREFTEGMLKEVLREAFNSGGDPDRIHVGAFNKQQMSTFVGNATRQVGAEDRQLYAAIDIYDSDFGELQIVPNRFSGTGTAFVLQSDMFAIAYLRQFQLHNLAKTGDSERRQLLTEYTLEVRNQAASGAVYDLTTSS
jgi:hypothetical protein